MTSVIIFEKDLEKLGRKLMEYFYETIHEDYYLNEVNSDDEKEFKEIILQREYYDKNVIDEYLKFVKRYREKNNIEYDSDQVGDVLKMEREDVLSKIECEIRDKTIDYNFVYHFLDQMDKKLKVDESLEFECNEDLYCMKKAFINMYEVFHFNNYHLNDL